MFKIGDFSKLSRVSVRMLRHYDELGLLKPERTDVFTGYRYYAARKLTRLNRILALKDLGLSLEQIAKMVNEGLTSEQIRGMLKLKQAELRQELIEGQIRLARVEAWLQQEEVIMPAYDVILKKVESMRVAEVRDIAPSMSLLGPTLDRLFDEAYSYASQNQALRPEPNPGITVYYDEEFREENINVGACFGVVGSLSSNERVKIHDLPGFEAVASVVHHGPFSGLPGAYKAVSDWIEANNYRLGGPTREINLEYERGGDQTKYVTEIQFPLKKAEL